jgi:hypothetical protein
MKDIKLPIAHNHEEAVAALRVTSLASSKATGKSIILKVPMMTNIANSAPVLSLRTVEHCSVARAGERREENVPAQISANHPAEMTGPTIRIVIAR